MPDPLLALVGRTDGASVTWTRRQGDMSLEVTAVPLPASVGRGRWALSLREVSRSIALPAAWERQLTPAQRELTSRVLRGWDNRLIADDLGCAEATVKRHLQNIFDRLGVSTRAALLASAAKR